MTKRKINIWIFLLIALLVLPSMAMAANSFFDQRYRGWLWFEESNKLETTKKEEAIFSQNKSDYSDSDSSSFDSD